MPPSERAKNLRPAMPADALWVFNGDLFVGNQGIVAEAETAGGLGAAPARAFADQPTPHQLDVIRKAAQRSRYGDNAVANIQLAFAGLSRVNVLQSRDTRRSEGDPLGEYDPNQPRVPAGSGSESGRWTDGQTATQPVQDRTRPPSLYHPIANAGDPRNNRMARDAAVAVGLTQDQRQDLHGAISGRGLSYQEILEIAKAIAAGTYQMASDSIDIDGALAIFDALKGEHVWAPERVLDEILSLQFGTPRLVVHMTHRMPAGPGMSDTHAPSRYAGAKGRWNLYVEGGKWIVNANGYTCGRSDIETLDGTRCLLALRGQVLTGTTYDAARREWLFGFDLGGTVTVAAPDPAMTVFTDYEWTLFRQGEPGLTCLRDDQLELGDG